MGLLFQSFFPSLLLRDVITFHLSLSISLLAHISNYLRAYDYASYITIISHYISLSQQKYIWTSGRLCDFKGCDRPDLQPVSINGWFWTAELQKLAPTTDRRQNDWSENGGIGQPQPDNRELQQGGAAENCLAILNNFYNDGVHWHDVGKFFAR